MEEEAVRTQKPVIEIQEENDQHLEEESMIPGLGGVVEEREQT